MNVIEQVLSEIDYYSPILKKHRYSMESIKKKAFISSGTASGILVEEIRKREASGYLDEAPALQDAADVAMESASYTDSPYQESKTEKKNSRFRKLKKKVATTVDAMVYDYSAVRAGELEDEIYDLINQDGFYDEILPIDYYFETGTEGVRGSPLLIAMYAVLAIALIAGTAFGIKIFLF